MLLIGLVGKGNEQAIDAAFHSYRLLDGGNLEDVARALGGVADRMPRTFLRGVKKHGLSARQMEGIVNMMPAHVIDDDEARARAIRARVQSLSSIKDGELTSERGKALAALRVSLEEARRHRDQHK
jgi:hypothetical protein